MKAKDYENVTLQDIIDVMTDKEKEDLYFRIGVMVDTFSKMEDRHAVISIVDIIKEVTGVNDLKLLYYGRALLDEIEEG